MGVHRHNGTQPGAETPICNECGVSLCWDIARVEYLEAKAFWDAWRCQDCNGSRLSAFGWKQVNGREALAPEVEAVVTAFAEANPGYETSEGPDRSLEASSAFVEALAAAGLAGASVIAADVRGKPQHAVAVGDFTVDWTAMRHDDAPFPLVYRTTLGWPCQPPTMAELLKDLSEMDPDDFQTLLASVVEKRNAAA